MARRLRPLAEREAIWAFTLALLGTISMYLTLPAALALAVRCIRGRTRGGDGSEPAIGALTITCSALAFMMGLPLTRSIVLSTSASPRAWSFAIGWALLASALALLVAFMLRSHPERWLARRLAVAGVVVVVAAGLLQLATSVAGGCDAFGGSTPDCVGATPWFALAPAVLAGGVWLTASLAAVGVGRLAREY